VGDEVDFDVAVQHLDDRVVVRVEGDLDLASADAFEDAMSTVAFAVHVVIDLGSCTFLDSAGMRVIAATARSAPRVSVVVTDPSVLRVLEITGVDTMVSVHASLDDVL
jgi:anti-sigma B factor antagonist